MENHERPQGGPGVPLPEPSTKDLMGKQSVRATFKLSEECIAALQIVATHLRIKQKSLFDHLMEDIDSLSSIGRELGDCVRDPSNRVQKTYVISRKALSSLEKISRDFNASRNTLIEYSVRRLLPIISAERRKHAQHKKLVLEIESHFSAGEDLLQRMRTSVGSEDPVAQRFESVLSAYAHMLQDMRELIEKGNVIEAFEEDSFRKNHFPRACDL